MVHQSAKKWICKLWNNFRVMVFNSTECGEICMRNGQGPSGSTTFKTGMILSWKSLHGLVSTVNTVHHALHKYRLKLYHAHDTETLLSSLGQSSFKVDWGKGGNWSEGRWIEIWNSLWKTWTPSPVDWRREESSSTQFKSLWWYWGQNGAQRFWTFL